MTGGAIDTLISLLSMLGESYASQPAAESKAEFKQAAVQVGLASRAKESPGFAMMSTTTLTSVFLASPMRPNPSIERTRPGLPGRASHVKR